jgi:hypothetical protein
MSSLHDDRGRLVIAFYQNGRKVRLYPGVRHTRENCRSPLVKELKVLIAGHQWAELAERFPQCRQLDQYRARRDAGLAEEGSAPREPEPGGDNCAEVVIRQAGVELVIRFGTSRTAATK